jgi:thiol-disulfide isomerase/thioredoxin
MSGAQMVKPLSIGDTVPGIIITNVYNYPASTIHLSDLKGKLVILDFWATWCSACIKNFPKMYGFQTKFKGQLQFLLVNTKSTKDDKTKIETFFNKRRNVYQLPSVISDTILNSLFPHKSIPHYVWIKDNRIKAISSDEEINQENIVAVINDQKINIPEKNDLDFDFRKPLFINDNGGNPRKYIFRSILTGYIDGLVSSNGIIYEKDKMAKRIFNTNASILNLYQQAYPEYGNYAINRIIFDVSNPSDYSLDSNSRSWKIKNLYTYELSFPPLIFDKALKLMQEDLCRYFNFSIYTENREAVCLVLYKSGSGKPLNIPENSQPETNIYEKNSAPKYLRNYPLIILTTYLNSILKIPVIDETGFLGNVNISLPPDLSDEDLLKDSLEKQGFILKREKRSLSFLIFHQNKSSY